MCRCESSLRYPAGPGFLQAMFWNSKLFDWFQSSRRRAFTASLLLIMFARSSCFSSSLQDSSQVWTWCRGGNKWMGYPLWSQSGTSWAPVVMTWAVNAFARAKLACPKMSAACIDFLMRASSSRHLRVILHSRSLHSVAAPLTTRRVPTAAKGCVRKVGTFPFPLHFLGSCWCLVCWAI